MAPEKKDFPWLAKLRHQVNTLCSEANDIIPQEPIQYVRSQFLTAGESIKKFCSELVDINMFPEIVTAPPVENAPMHPKQEQNTDSPDDLAAKSDAVKFSPHITDEKVYASKSSVLATLHEQDEMGNNLSTSVQPLIASFEKTEEGSNFSGANFCVELPDDEVVSSDDSISSTCEGQKEFSQLGFIEIFPNSDSSECISSQRAPDCCVTELGSQATQPNICSDEDQLSYQKTEFHLSNKKSASQGDQVFCAADAWCRKEGPLFSQEYIWSLYECQNEALKFRYIEKTDSDSSDEHVSAEEAPVYYVTEPSGDEMHDQCTIVNAHLSDQKTTSDMKYDKGVSCEPSGDEMHDQSTIVVDTPDYDMINARLSDQKTTSVMKFSKTVSCENVSEDIGAKTDEETGDCAKETTTWDEDLSDCDWEFI